MVLPVRHPLAGEDTVGLRALADEPVDGFRCHSSQAWISTCPVILPSRSVSMDSESTRMPSA